MRMRGSLHVVLVLTVLLGFSSLSNARVLDKVEIKVRVNVPVIQQLEIIEPVAVSFSYPWAGAENGQPLIFHDVGNVLVRSNADWSMAIDSTSSSGFRVCVRPSGERFAQWVPANGLTSLYGSQGMSNLSWDVRIEPPQSTEVAAGHQTVRFSLTIGHM